MRTATATIIGLGAVLVLLVGTDALAVRPALLAFGAVVAVAAVSTLWAAGPPPARRMTVEAPARPMSDALRPFVTALPDPAILVDDDGRIILSNGPVETVFGVLSPGEMLSHVVRSPTLLEALDAVLRTRQALRVDYEQRVPFERRFEVQMVPLDLPDGAMSEVRLRRPILIMLRDLTQQEKVERMRADFVAHASHELRTPLAAVLGFIETLQGAARDDAPARDRFLGLMQAQALRMKRLIEDLLSLSRIELNAHIRPDATIDLEQAVRHVVEYLAPLARDAGIEVIGTYPQAPIMVQGDWDELVQVFQNLIENAVKYGGEGGSIDIEVVRGADAGGAPVAEVSVRDHGPGIAPEHIPRLTERFYRVDVGSSRAKGGTGLGLAIVKHIVNRHRGRLVVKSELGAGSTFTVRLPARPQAAVTG
jgi:two-component system phosphate regulon sensor histidine kinase PhoR